MKVQSRTGEGAKVSSLPLCISIMIIVIEKTKSVGSDLTVLVSGVSWVCQLEER